MLNRLTGLFGYHSNTSADPAPQREAEDIVSSIKKNGTSNDGWGMMLCPTQIKDAIKLGSEIDETIHSPECHSFFKDIDNITAITQDYNNLITTKNNKEPLVDGQIGDTSRILSDLIFEHGKLLKHISTFFSSVTASTLLEIARGGTDPKLQNVINSTRRLQDKFYAFLQAYNRAHHGQLLTTVEGRPIKTVNDALQHFLGSTVSELIQSACSPYLALVATNNDAQSAFALNNDEATLASFRKLPPIVRNAAVVAMQEINEAFLNAIQFLDDKEMELGLKEGEEGKLFEYLTLKLSFPNDSPLSLLALNGKTPKEFLLNIWNPALKKRLEICAELDGYNTTATSELAFYPFESLRYHHRCDKLSQLQSTYHETLMNLENKAIQRTILNDIKTARDHIGNSKHDSESKENIAKALKLYKKIIDVVKIQPNRFESIASHIKELEADETLTPQMKDIVNAYKQSYSTAKKHYESWKVQHDDLLDRYNKRLALAEESNPTLPLRAKAPKSNRSNLVYHQFKVLLDSANSALAKLTGQSTETVAKDKSVVYDTLIHIQKMLADADTHLISMIDEKIYDHLFKNNPKGKHGENEPIKHIAIALHSAQESTTALLKLSSQFSTAPSKLNVTSPTEALTEAINNATAVTTHTDKLLAALQALKHHPITAEHFSSIHSSIAAAVNHVLPSDWAKMLLEPTGKTAEPASTDNTTPLPAIQNMQKNFLDRFSFIGDRIQKSSILSNDEKLVILSTYDTIKTLWSEDLYPKVDANTLTVTALMKIIFQRFSALITLKDKLSSSYAALAKLNLTESKALLESLHGIFKATFLLLDKLEIELYLKPGSLTKQSLSFYGMKEVIGEHSFESLAKYYEDLADSYHIPISFDNRYPYTKAATRQSLALTENINPLTEVTKYDFRRQRFELKRQQLRNDVKCYTQSLHERAPKQYIEKLIDNRITELQRELDSWFVWSRTTKRVKISLLTHLKDALRKNTLEKACDIIHQHTGFRGYTHLLFDGRTGKLLDTIKTCELSPLELRKHIDQLITNLDKQLHYNWFWSFFVNKDSIHNQIDALQALKEKITNPNRSLRRDQMSTLLEHEPTIYNFVLQTQAELLELKAMNQSFQDRNLPGMTH